MAGFVLPTYMYRSQIFYLQIVKMIKAILSGLQVRFIIEILVLISTSIAISALILVLIPHILTVLLLVIPVIAIFMLLALKWVGKYSDDTTYEAHFRCLSCMTRHDQHACPKCGSKIKRLE